MALEGCVLELAGGVFMVIGGIPMYGLLSDTYFQPNPFVRHHRAEYLEAALLMSAGVVICIVGVL